MCARGMEELYKAPTHKNTHENTHVLLRLFCLGKVESRCHGIRLLMRMTTYDGLQKRHVSPNALVDVPSLGRKIRGVASLPT